MTDWLSEQAQREAEWQHTENLHAEIRRLRAMVLRAHGWRLALGVDDQMWTWRQCGRAARLFNHYATAIEAGRL